MKKEIIDTILMILVGIVMLALAVAGLVKLSQWSDADEVKYKQEQKQELSDCMQRVDDFGWCYDLIIIGEL